MSTIFSALVNLGKRFYAGGCLAVRGRSLAANLIHTYLFVQRHIGMCNSEVSDVRTHPAGAHLI